MIDTMDITYKFPTIESYNKCYEIVNRMATEVSHGRNLLHKKEENHYITTALKPIGFSEIEFSKQQEYKQYKIKIIIKPIRLIYPNSYIRLAEYGDFEEISRRFNKIVEVINNKAGKELLVEFGG